MNKKGLSIAELLAVVVVMGIIAAIAIPLIGNTIDKMKKKAFIDDIISISEAKRLYVMASNDDPYRTLEVNKELKYYLSKDFSNYEKALTYNDNNDKTRVNLKNDTYETRIVFKGANNNFIYRQESIPVTDNMELFVNKNKN